MSSITGNGFRWRRAMVLGALALIVGCATFRHASGGAGRDPDGPIGPITVAFSERELVPGMGLYAVSAPASVSDLIEVVWQKKAANRDELASTYCATLAVIKAGMATFGVDGVAQTLTPLPGRDAVDVVLRDGHSVRLHGWQLELVARSVHFGVLDPTSLGPHPRRLERWVQFYVAVAAANLTRFYREQEQSPRHISCASTPLDDEQWFREALVSIVNGFNTARAPRLLGLATTDTAPTDGGLRYAVGWTSRHAMFVAAGMGQKRLVDRWGDVSEYSGSMRLLYLADARGETLEAASDSGHWDPLRQSRFVCARGAYVDQQGDPAEPDAPEESSAQRPPDSPPSRRVSLAPRSVATAPRT